MITVSEFADYAIKLSKASKKNSFEAFLDRIDTLLANDASLRGDLAHTYFYLFSRPRKLRERSWSFNRMAEAIVEFQIHLAELDIVDIDPHAFLEKQSLTQFIKREHDNPKDRDGIKKRKLGWAFSFILGVAVVDGEAFAAHHINRDTGQISGLLELLSLSIARDETSFSTLLNVIEEFEQRRTIQKNASHDFAGTLEIGDLQPESLWQPIFGSDPLPREMYRQQYSLERYFMFYRFSTTGDVDRLIKSFFVIQSPGLIKSRLTGNIRDQFAFKLFYRVGNGDIRRSAGGVYKLGPIVTFYGGSRIEENPMTPDITRNANDLLGPEKMVINLDCFGRDRPILGGVVTSMNELDKTFSTRFICVETHRNHSSEAGIGSHRISDMIPPKNWDGEVEHDEFGTYTIFGEEGEDGRFIEAKDRVVMFDNMIRLLKGEGKSFVTPPSRDDLAIPAMRQR